MNKLLIGLLIVAAGTGTFLLLRKKNKQKASFDKEWIVGKWNTQAPDPVIDSSFQPYRYDFQKDGSVLRSLNDSVSADTMHYEWNKANELVWKENKTDSAGTVFSVVKLTKDTLQVMGVDSLTILLTRLK